MPTVTVTTLRERGYPVSTLNEPAKITLAENDVKFAYFPTTEVFSSESVLSLLHALVYSALLRRKIVSTRYGSVEKVSQYTISADEKAITEEIRGYCLARLEAYEAESGFECKDILRIYDRITEI